MVIGAFAPATVSNVGCGFDVLGFALDAPGDVVVARALDHSGVEILDIDGDDGRLPRDPAKNTASTAAHALLTRLGTRQGIGLTIHKGMPLASGIGSSGASAVAAVVAVNELLGRPASLDVLLACAMEGEVAGCGAAHPDNVAPALYGGFLLARPSTPLRASSMTPPDVVPLPVPSGLSCALLHPHVEVKTADARAVLGDTVALRDAVQQWANVGALVAALHSSDLALLSRALEDRIAEPKRASLVAGLPEVKEAAKAVGALGCSLSGAGPSMFALCASRATAEAAGTAMRDAYRTATGRDADVWVSPVGAGGARIVTL
jgi:homoserine kinase